MNEVKSNGFPVELFKRVLENKCYHSRSPCESHCTR